MGSIGAESLRRKAFGTIEARHAVTARPGRHVHSAESGTAVSQSPEWGPSPPLYGNSFLPESSLRSPLLITQYAIANGSIKTTAPSANRNQPIASTYSLGGRPNRSASNDRMHVTANATNTSIAVKET